MSRSEQLRRLSRVGTGRFVCDQRDAGGQLWIIDRSGRSDWSVRAHVPAEEKQRSWRLLGRRPEAPAPVVLGSGQLRAWINQRATELEGPGEVTRCAGRSAVAHEITAMVDGRCPICGERDAPGGSE